MNWRRGFVRLSLALSACYVALVVAAIGPNTFTALYRSSAVYEISFESGTTQRFDTSQSRNELLQEIVRAYRAAAAALAASGKQKEANETIANLESYSNALLNELNARDRHRREEAKTALAVAAIPPVILWVLGILFGWIARGFRRGDASLGR